MADADGAYSRRDTMKRRTYFMTEEQHAWLEKKAAKMGIKISELLRRIIDEYRKREGEKK